MTTTETKVGPDGVETTVTKKTSGTGFPEELRTARSLYTSTWLSEDGLPCIGWSAFA